ncbi:hypothetical protein E2C01_029987 [Portunus trituberculatus]|uniref:Uncharacterized protein n=1 Tax=Portunus trituberculatus TaxID=210409 RepID=A0A5B7ET02_PORTR|nr:hypothetical protein [Portunus trituberculatus]
MRPGDSLVAAATPLHRSGPDACSQSCTLIASPSTPSAPYPAALESIDSKSLRPPGGLRVSMARIKAS